MDDDSSRQAWLAERRKGIGGSDIAAIVGVDPYKSAWGVYFDKVEAGEDDETEAMLWGRLLEATVAEEWARRNDSIVERGSFIRHPEHPWWCGTPDYYVDYVHLLEVKTCSNWSWQTTWEDGAYVPLHVECQAQWYMGLTGIDVCWLAVLVGGSTLKSFRIEKDYDAVERLWHAGEAFWREHVAARVPPAPDGSAATRAALERAYPARVEPRRILVEDDEVMPAVDAYRRHAKLAKVHERFRDEAANLLRMMLGEYDADEAVLAGGDRPLFTWKPVRHLDLEGLAADPDVDASLIPQCMRTLPDMRAMRTVFGTKVVDAHMTPSSTRRLYVAPRPDEEDPIFEPF